MRVFHSALLLQKWDDFVTNYPRACIHAFINKKEHMGHTKIKEKAIGLELTKMTVVDTQSITPEIEEKADDESHTPENENEESEEDVTLDEEELNPFGDKWEQ
jgi:hypothetical protein